MGTARLSVGRLVAARIGAVRMPAQVQKSRGEILLHFVLLPASVLDGGDQGTAIDDRDIEVFH